MLKQFLLSDKHVSYSTIPRKLDAKLDDLQNQEIFLLNNKIPKKIGGGKYHTVYKTKVMQGNEEKEVIWKSIATNTKVDMGRTSSAYMSGINKIEGSAALAERSILTKTLDNYLFPNNSVCAGTKAANMLPGSFGGNANASSSGIIMDMAKGKAIALREVTFDLSKGSDDANNIRAFNSLSNYISDLNNIDAFLLLAITNMEKFHKKYPQLQASKFFSRLKIIDTKMEFNDTNVLKKALEGTIRLGILDYISGQVDRHYENYYVANDGTITAIDNDMSFGSEAGSRGQKSFLIPNKGSLLVNLPKVITSEIRNELVEFFRGENKVGSFLKELERTFSFGSKEYTSFCKRMRDVEKLLYGDNEAMVTDDILSNEAMDKMDSESNYLIRDLLVRQSDATGIVNKFGWNQFRANRKAMKLDRLQLKRTDRLGTIKSQRYSLKKVKRYMPGGTTDKFVQYMIDNDLIGPNFRPSTKKFSELSKEYRHKYGMYGRVRSGIANHFVNDTKTMNKIKDKENVKQWWIKAPKELHMFRGMQGFVSVDYLLGDPVGTFANNINNNNLEAITGRIMCDKSATSTSITEKVSKHYATRDNRSKEVIMVKLTCPEGMEICPIGNQWDEIVMKPGQQQKIKNVRLEERNGFKWVTIEADLFNDDAISDDIMANNIDNITTDNAISTDIINDNATANSVLGESRGTEIDFKSNSIISNMISYEDEFYKTKLFKGMQEEFEIELGKYAYNSDISYNALHKIINSMKKKINNEENKKKFRNKILYFLTGEGRFRNKDIHEIYREQFFSSDGVNQANFSGAVGSNLSNEEIDGLLKEEKPIIEDATNELTAPGNLREKLLAIQSFFVNRKEEKNWVGKSNNPVEPHIGRHMYRNKNENRWEKKVRKHKLVKGTEDYKNAEIAFNAKYDRALDYQDQMKLYRSAREKRYQEANKKSVTDPNNITIYKSPISYGQRLWKPTYKTPSKKNSKYVKLYSFNGKRLVAGTSGTTERLIASLKAQNFRDINEKDLLNFRFAIMGCMLPEKNHSLYEILQGSHEVGVKGNENLGTAHSMDRSVAPLSEEKIRRKIGSKLKSKYKINSKQDGVLPLEASYAEYIKKKMLRQNNAENV